VCVCVVCVVCVCGCVVCVYVGVWCVCVCVCVVTTHLQLGDEAKTSVFRNLLNVYEPCIKVRSSS